MDSSPGEGDDRRHRVISYPSPDAPPASGGVGDDPTPGAGRNPPLGNQGWSTRNKAIAGVAAAAVLGLGLGLGALMMPHDGSGSDQALAAATASRSSDDHLSIEVHRRPPPAQPIHASAGKLDAASTVMQPAQGAVASSVPEQADPQAERQSGLKGFLGRLFGGGGGSDQASVDQDTRQAQAPRVARQEAQAPARPADVEQPQAPAEPPRPFVPPRPPQPTAQAQPTAQVQPSRTDAPSFDCAAARMRSEQMVCQVPSLAAADRRMAQAYRAARIAGVPSDMLVEQQHRWYRARERAAVSPAAIGMVYDQRIAELERLRDQARQRSAENQDSPGY